MLKIRRATPDDSRFIAETYRPFVEDSWASFEHEAPDVSEIASRIAAAGDRYPWLIAEDDAPLAYTYASQHRSRAAYSTSVDTAIYCASRARGKGIGKRLYQRLFEVLTQQNYVMAFAGIALPNTASIGLHKSLGFQLIGTYPNVGYKHGDWRDTQWWGKTLSQPIHPPNPILPLSQLNL